jgi:dTDP-4-dehydrorhamnose 3,5-epimerase
VKLEATSLAGLYRIVPEVHVDDRGELWRSYCRQDLAENGLAFDVCQSNVSVNLHRHTLRGFHYQRPPSTEQKILTVMVGSLHAVIVDIRPDSPTFLSHEAFGFEVGDRSSLLVPDGCATGFLTLADDTIVHYQMSDYFQPGNYTGFRYDDPAIGVEWPAAPAVISDRDRSFADFEYSGQ